MSGQRTLILSPEQARISLQATHIAGRDGREIPTAGEQLLASHEAMRGLLIEADAEISHVLYRGSLASESWTVESLIARLRKAAQGWVHV